ncbi:MAG TPA: hypothetical protein DCX06_05930 [Opitutae bacterium]|nr:hypothetical protein [Opitutae bacterium]
MKKYTYLTLLALLTLGFTTSASAMTEKQLASKKKYFLKFDANKDNALSEAEYIEMTRIQFEKKSKPGWEQEGAKRFKRNDTNSSGAVTFEEWISNQK